MEQPEHTEDRRFWNLPDLEQYVLSVSLHNRQALAKAMSNLVSARDFKDVKNRKAFGVLEARYEAGAELDPVVIVDTWKDLGIYSAAEARAVASAWEGDPDFEPKISELQKAGGMRQAKKDIAKLNELTGQDTTPEQLSQKAFDMAVRWNIGHAKKYYTAAEVERMEKEQQVGEKLSLGIPLLDESIYRNAGLCKGTVKGKIFRSKHGKTRQQCWEVAQHLRQGRTVLYFTLEGQNADIAGNVRENLQSEWDRHKERLLLRDATVDLDSIRGAIIEAAFAEEVDVVVVDYLQEMTLNVGRWIDENTRYNECVRELTRLAVRYDFLLDLLSQVTTEDRSKSGWGNVPAPHDAYGSKQIIKAASLLLVGFRPNQYPELVKKDPIPGSDNLSAKDMDGQTIPYSSVFMKPVRSRKKIGCLHRYVHFVDTDSGYKLHSHKLI